MWFHNAEPGPDAYFHAHTISVGGVIIPKKDIESVSATIRENPELYRLGKEFYSEEESKLNQEQFERCMRKAYETMGKYGDYEQEAQTFLARIRQVYGTEYASFAKSVYERWQVSKRERDGY